MKRKLLSIVSVVLAMSMTTSAFAATARGTGDVDNDGQITANDVLAILTGKYAQLEGADQANVANRANGVSGVDANVLYQTILQPKYVSEDLALRVYTENYSIGSNPIDVIEGAEDLGSTVGTNEYGTGVVNDAVTLDGVTTISDAITKLASLATDSAAASLTEQLNNISFVSELGEDVYLRNEDGWAKLCWALGPIIPLSYEDAVIVNRVDDAATDEEIAAKQDQVDALNAIKAYVVSDKTLTAADVQDIATQLLIAFPNDITEDEVKATAARVLEITDQKYVFTADYNEMEDEVISASAVEIEDGETTYEASDFVNILAEFMSGYQDKTIAELRTTFGDKVAVTAQNTQTGADPISLVAEVVVKASYNPDGTTAATEATTEVTTEATTETTTETTTTETTTEAATEEDTETTTEAATEEDTETTTEEATEDTTESEDTDADGSGFVGTASISAADVYTAFNGAGLVDGDEIADGVTIINSASAFTFSERSFNFNDGELALSSVYSFQIGRGNNTISATHAVGDVLDDTEVIEKAIKFSVGGSGTITVYAGLGSSGVEDATIYLVNLDTNEIVAISNINRPGGSGSNYYVEAITVPEAGNYAFLQPGNVSSLNVAQIDISINA